MKTKIIYFVLCVIFFGVGVYTWKVTHTGRTSLHAPKSDSSASNLRVRTVLVEIAGKPITNEDLDWEYQLQTFKVFEDEELSSVSNLGQVDHKELSPLKQRLIAGMIERKLLFEYIKLDSSFILTDSSRYTRCLSEWKDALKSKLELLKLEKDQQRLKKRLCESNIVMQYVKEKINSRIIIPETEIVEYYKNHANEFKKPRRVEIRQIVLPDEKTARKVRYKVMRSNFSKMAVEHSITPEAMEGGHLGPFAKGEMPSVFDVAFLMGRGQISPIMKSTYGFHIIMVTKKHRKEELNLAQATPQIRKTVLEKKKQEEYQKLVERALSAITVSAPSTNW